MRHLKLSILCGAALVAGLAFAADRFAETVSLSSGSAVLSTLKYSQHAAISCDGEVRYRTCTASASCTAVATDAKLTNFDLPVDICLGNGGEFISLIRTGSSTVTCNLYTVTPVTRPCK